MQLALMRVRAPRDLRWKAEEEREGRRMCRSSRQDPTDSGNGSEPFYAIDFIAIFLNQSSLETNHGL